jgi:hypothetical protein
MGRSYFDVMRNEASSRTTFNCIFFSLKNQPSGADLTFATQPPR